MVKFILFVLVDKIWVLSTENETKIFFSLNCNIINDFYDFKLEMKVKFLRD